MQELFLQPILQRDQVLFSELLQQWLVEHLTEWLYQFKSCLMGAVFITEDLKYRLGLSLKRVETLNLRTFGDKVYRKQRCELVEVELFKGNGDSLNL